LLGLFISFFLGRKIGTDKEFRSNYVPSWFNFSVDHDESAITREELHEQMVRSQIELHERAIRGDFSPENLALLRNRLSQLESEYNGEAENDASPRREQSRP
jgi:hypothetical protein